MIREPRGDPLSAEPVRVPAAVPALVVVEDPGGDGLDAERVEHPVADLRMAPEHELLRAGQRAGLAEDLLGDGELSEVVQAAGDAHQLDLLRLEPQLLGDARGELPHDERVTARVGVPARPRRARALRRP